MSPEERINSLEQENRALREQLAQRDELITQLQQCLQTLEERLGKDSHNSHLHLSTLRKQGLPLLSALQAALQGHPLLPSFQTT